MSLAGVLLCIALSCAIASLGAAPDVSGKWHFVLDTPDGSRDAHPEFQQNGENVTGKWEEADVKGTFADGKLDLSFPIESPEAGPGTLKITGKFDGETLTGTWAFQDYNGEFKATREK